MDVVISDPKLDVETVYGLSEQLTAYRNNGENVVMLGKLQTAVFRALLIFYSKF